MLNSIMPFVRVNYFLWPSTSWVVQYNMVFFIQKSLRYQRKHLWWSQGKEWLEKQWSTIFKVFFFNYLFSQRVRKGEGEGETLMYERTIDWLPLACALTRNWTTDLLLCRVMPNKLRYTCQGLKPRFYLHYHFMHLNSSETTFSLEI